MKKIRQFGRQVVLGQADPSLTPRAGLKLVAEVNRILSVADTLDGHIAPIKKRNRGLSAGKLVLSIAETMLGGGDFLTDLDHQRVDEAGQAVRAVPEVPASTTVIDLGKRFSPEVLAGVEAGVGDLVGRWFDALDHDRRARLVAARPTIDLDPTDVEVYGAQKRGVAYNHQGQLVGRPHPAVWAEAGVVLAAVLGSGVDDPRPQAPGLIATAVAALPEGLSRPIIRGDSGFFDAKVAQAALAAGADYAIAAKRNNAVWRAMRDIPEDSWVSAKAMHAEVAEAAYRPTGWPPATRCVVRRVRVDASELRHDSRSRRRRTIDPQQLPLLEAGEIGHAYAYSFIVTNLAWDPVDIEAWFRQRALVEERLKDAKLGMAMRHLPSGYVEVNALWMWSAFLALNLSVFVQSLARVDGGGRAHGKRLRRELICIVARVLSHARTTVLRLAPEDRHGIFADAWTALVAVPSLPGP